MPQIFMNITIKEKILSEIKTAYLLDPTSQPTAFWKIEKWFKNEQVALREEKGLYALVQENRLLLKWPNTAGYIEKTDKNYDLLVFKTSQNLGADYQLERFFKLFHQHEDLKDPDLPEHYAFQVVDELELNDLVSFINESYEHIKVSLNEVENWRKSHVFQEDLWLWLVDENGHKVALGIAERDLEIKEGALEWIQVKKGHRGYGLGKSLVNELLMRLSKQADFTSVSGQSDNLTHPELLYRNCGFVGENIWHIYRRL